MDTSDLPPDHPCYIAKRKEIPCLFSDETNGLVMTHFCTLRAKSYAYRINGKENIRAKGIRGHVVKNHMNFKDHYRCLFGDVTLDTKTENVLIHSFKHQLKTIKSSKVTLIVSMIRGLYLRIKYIPWLMDTTPLRKPIH
ncbi:uncharacterized protein LOC107885037 [Acyrthosiphon pisum]|uniref:Uncharacterized protein n=1 Tax=Acyrthosiphon pisum TaxID=7029 RepID=A0A8R2HBH4_ACYPI|nr:uncharacterized protein LOC107885037 [Acyrthosiphon pisum]|eukprot:XP_016663863.1 PREDICTED: uncharacterized protein LOC107885037 [Acyrthosiphon pisum]